MYTILSITYILVILACIYACAWMTYEALTENDGPQGIFDWLFVALFSGLTLMGVHWLIVVLMNMLGVP